MIEVKNVSKSFQDGVKVLDNINTVFESGKTNLIIGQSGSGKTVLMKSTVGIHKVDRGHILYDGRDITVMNEKQLKMMHREIGMLFQGSALFDSMTVLENVMFPLDMFSDMDEEQKIARAIVLNPKYLFCDEPNSGLDPKTSLMIDRLIQEITHEFNITTIINTHDMNSVMEIGENIVFIYKGQKGWQGNKDQVYDTGCQPLEDLIFASELYKKIKTAHFTLGK